MCLFCFPPSSQCQPFLLLWRLDMLTQAWERCRCYLLHVGSLGFAPYLCMLLPSLIFYLLSTQTCKPLPVHAKKASLFRKIKTCLKYFDTEAFAVWGLPCVGCALNCAEMLSQSKTLFIDLLSALKLSKSQSLLHNPTFLELGVWEGFALVLCWFQLDTELWFPILMCCLWLFHTSV